MGTKWDEKMRWERLPGGKNCQPFNEDDDNEDKEKKMWIDSNNVYPKVKEEKNARN